MVNNFILSFASIFYLKYMMSSILKYSCMVLLVNMFFYYNFFMDLKNSMILSFKSLMDFTALHYFDLLNEIELNYFILSYSLGLRIMSKIFVKKEDLMISLSKIFLNSSWLESEVWDMFGVKFMFHSDLSSILTDYGFLSHPLLKHFPLSGFYELSFDEMFNKMMSELMELAQAFRSFSYMNSWVKWYT